MANVLRLIEVQAESDTTWEDAAARAVGDLGRQLLENIDSIHAEFPRGKDEDGEMLRYRIEARISLSWSRPALAPPIAAPARAMHDRNRRLPG